jgi:hypothetical protein
MNSIKRRRQSEPLVGADCLDLESLHLSQILNQYDANEHANLSLAHKQMKEYYKKLKFTFQESEAKRLFIEALQSVDSNGEGLPSMAGSQQDPQYVTLEQSCKDKRKTYQECKDRVSSLKQSLSEQLSQVLQMYDSCIQQKTVYDKTWEDEMNGSMFGNNQHGSQEEDTLSKMIIPETQGNKLDDGYEDIFQTIIPETQDVAENMTSDLERISRRLSFHNEVPAEIATTRHQPSPISTNSGHLSQMNEVLSWLNGVRVLEVFQSSSSVTYRLQYTAIQPEVITIQISLEKVIGIGHHSDIWKLNLVQVLLPNATMQQELNFEDVVQVGRRMNDVGFIVREVEDRILNYKQQRVQQKQPH